MSKTALIIIFAVSLPACGDREISILIHTPESCCNPLETGRDCVEDPCPLRNVVSIRTSLERAGRIVATEQCVSPPQRFCTYENLAGFTLISDVEPSGGVEVRIDGFYETGCSGDLYFRCESFGENTVDLRDEDITIPMWCECAPLVR